jgi:hypothetical protein
MLTERSTAPLGTVVTNGIVLLFNVIASRELAGGFTSSTRAGNALAARGLLRELPRGNFAFPVARRA